MRLGTIVQRLLRGKFGQSIVNSYLYSNLYQEEFFVRMMQFIRSNNISGDYLEFGCYMGNTFLMAHRHRHLSGTSMKLYVFDSFQGHPEYSGFDASSKIKKGDQAVSIQTFTNILKKHGVKETEYTLVPGFYDESLKANPPEMLGLRSAAIVYVDCVSYESTVPVLNYVLPLLQNGTIIAFDDFFLFKGDPEHGQRLAMTEFLERNSEIKLINYLPIGWHGRSFIVKKS